MSRSCRRRLRRDENPEDDAHRACDFFPYSLASEARACALFGVHGVAVLCVWSSLSKTKEHARLLFPRALCTLCSNQKQTCVSQTTDGVYSRTTRTKVAHLARTARVSPHTMAQPRAPRRPTIPVPAPRSSPRFASPLVCRVPCAATCAARAHTHHRSLKSRLSSCVLSPRGPRRVRHVSSRRSSARISNPTGRISYPPPSLIIGVCALTSSRPRPPPS